MSMKFLSICSGIEAASVAWEGLGWSPVAFSEVAPFPSAVLAHHYPSVPNLGDMTKFEDWELNESIDVICGGTPCQAFSIAGQRKSLEDERGNLSLTFCQICDKFDPEIIIWENVPGVLNTKDNAFGCFLAELAGLEQPVAPPRKHTTKFDNFGVVNGSKRCVAWRVLDAQYFGVPQRRRRVFVVAFRGTGNWRSAATLFPISDSVRRPVAPSRSQRAQVATFINNRFASYSQSTTAATTKSSGGDFGGGSETLVVHGSQDPGVNENFANPIDRNNGLENVVIVDDQGGSSINIKKEGITGTGVAYSTTTADVHPTLTIGFGDRGMDLGQMAGGGAVLQTQHNHTTVRRLTPVECERLQGFPDNYTKIPYRNKPAQDCPDSPRYKALGNSWAVPVVRWIGQRIMLVKDM